MSRSAHVNGVLGISLLHLLPHFGIVCGMIPDTMHAVCLGITKMVLEIWFTPGKRFSLKKIYIDKSLKLVKPPVEIVRMYPSLDRYFSDWKASELRYFLHFYSPVVLKKYLPLKDYKHWFLLVNFMRRLAKQTISNRDLQVCRILAVRFTRSIPKLYGKKYVRYNVHLLTHIVDSVQTWGVPCNHY